MLPKVITWGVTIRLSNKYIFLLLKLRQALFGIVDTWCDGYIFGWKWLYLWLVLCLVPKIFGHIFFVVILFDFFSFPGSQYNISEWIYTFKNICEQRTLLKYIFFLNLPDREQGGGLSRDTKQWRHRSDLSSIKKHIWRHLPTRRQPNRH